MSNVGYCLNFWWPHRKTSNKTLKHKKIALRFRDRKLSLFFKYYPPRSQKPSMNFHVYNGLLLQINGKYAWKYFNCSAILMLVCRKPVQKYSGMLRPLPRPRPYPPAFPHARCSSHNYVILRPAESRLWYKFVYLRGLKPSYISLSRHRGAFTSFS